MTKSVVFILIFTRASLAPNTKNSSYKTYESLIPLKLEDV